VSTLQKNGQSLPVASPTDSKSLISREEACVALGVSRQALAYRSRTGRLPIAGRDEKGHILYRREQIERLTIRRTQSHEPALIRSTCAILDDGGTALDLSRKLGIPFKDACQLEAEYHLASLRIVISGDMLAQALQDEKFKTWPIRTPEELFAALTKRVCCHVCGEIDGKLTCARHTLDLTVKQAQADESERILVRAKRKMAHKSAEAMTDVVQRAKAAR
jgi:DNA-binding transcriptional MerR regulator